MPFTPFHFGPALLIGLLFFPILDLPALLVSSVIIDIEPIYLGFQGAPYLHGFFHSYLGASILAVFVALAVYPFRKILNRILAVFMLPQRSSFIKILAASFVGAYSHIFLDSFLYSEMQPFYPFEANPFLGVVSSRTVYSFCSVSFLLGLVLYVYRAVKAQRRLAGSRPNSGF